MTLAFSQRCLDLAVRLADAAGPIVRSHYRTDVVVEDKADASPVTVVDRAVESELRRLITAEFPEHGIVGEEHDPYQRDAEYVWVLDPIDGTKAFICGIPVFGTLIGLTRGGQPILGVIDQPVLHERWVGGVGHATLFNGKSVQTRRCASWSQATVCVTTPDMFRGADAVAFQRIRDVAKWIRYGTDCYGYGLLASGFVDVVVEADVKVHDYVAPAAIIQGAGGVVSDWAGNALDLNAPTDRIVAAGDPAMHERALAALSGD